MKGKTIKEFLETLSWGEEMEFIYNGETFFIQGVNNGKNDKEIQLFSCDKPGSIIYSLKCKSFETGIIQFQKDKILDGKTIYDLDDSIIVIYG